MAKHRRRSKHLDDEANRTRTEKSFIVDKQEIVDNEYVLSFNKYQKKEIVKKEYRSTKDIIKSIKNLEEEFTSIMREIEEMG